MGQELPVCVVVVREGMSTPSEEAMRAAVEKLAPDAVDAPRRPLAQPRWWSKEEWVESGLRGVASALAEELSIDPWSTTWRLGTDDRGARLAVLLLRK